MKKLAVFCCLLLTMSATSAMASMSGTLYSNNAGPYIGTTDTSGGLVAINAVVGQLTWTVDQLESGLWDYTYQYVPVTADKNRGPGSINIEFGEQPTDLTWDYTYLSASNPITAEPDMYDATTTGTLSTIDKTMYSSWLSASDPIGTNVDVTSTFQGLTWVIDETNPKGCITLTLNLTTSLAPTWGNIYMDGYNITSNNGYGMLRNTKYDTDFTGTFAYIADGFDYVASAFVGWVATPGAAAVPVPASLLLFGSGLGGLFIFKRRSLAC